MVTTSGTRQRLTASILTGLRPRWPASARSPESTIPASPLSGRPLTAAGGKNAFADALQKLAAAFPHDAVVTADHAETTRAEASNAAHLAAASASERDRAAQHKESSHRAALGEWRAAAKALGLPDTLAAVKQEAEDAGVRAAAVSTAVGLVQDGGQRHAPFGGGVGGRKSGQQPGVADLPDAPGDPLQRSRCAAEDPMGEISDVRAVGREDLTALCRYPRTEIAPLHGGQVLAVVAGDDRA
ncbi:hypothetical protein [Streptomyces drozdowiczii]|uniref:hypothetical protein n=1 Tax=Streptomyces drozdowiczii TaxID=202862 RepID=UPI00403C3642